MPHWPSEALCTRPRRPCSGRPDDMFAEAVVESIVEMPNSAKANAVPADSAACGQRDLTK
jgi:hypothetical protein